MVPPNSRSFKTSMGHIFKSSPFHSLNTMSLVVFASPDISCACFFFGKTLPLQLYEIISGQPFKVKVKNMHIQTWTMPTVSNQRHQIAEMSVYTQRINPHSDVVCPFDAEPPAHAEQLSFFMNDFMEFITGQGQGCGTP